VFWVAMMADLHLWSWKAIDKQGVLKQGVMLLSGKSTLAMQLAEHQLLLVSARKRRGMSLFRASMPDKIEFIKQIAVLLKAGITLTEALTLIADQHPKPEWSALLQNIKDQVTKGVPFAEALQAWPRIFPPLFIALLHTGELTGKLAECCQHLAVQQEQLYQLQKKVHKALRYPLFILLIASLVTVGMLGLVLPEFAQIYQSFNAPLPALTQTIITGAEWLTEWALSGGSLLILLGAMVMYLRKNRPEWQIREQKLLLTLPLIAPLWRGQILSQIFAVLALTQQAGIPLLQGLSAAGDTLSQRLWRQQLDSIRDEISVGTPFWQALGTTVCFTPLCRQLIRVGEESGALDLMLERLADWHTQQAGEQAENLTAQLEPLMIVIIGVIIGVLVIAMYLPIFNLGEVMG